MREGTRGDGEGVCQGGWGRAFRVWKMEVQEGGAKTHMHVRIFKILFFSPSPLLTLREIETGGNGRTREGRGEENLGSWNLFCEEDKFVGVGFLTELFP